MAKTYDVTIPFKAFGRQYTNEIAYPFEEIPDAEREKALAPFLADGTLVPNAGKPAGKASKKS